MKTSIRCRKSARTLAVGLCGIMTGLAAQTASAAKAYVSSTGGNVSPYDSWANAATSLDTALSVQPDEVEIGDGTFAHTGSQRVLTWKCYIHSSNGPSKTTLSSAKLQGHFRLEAGSEGSLLAGLTFLNGYYDPTGADFKRCAPLYLTCGTISNCVVKGEFKYHHSYAPIVYLAGDAQAVDSDFEGDWDGSTHAADGASPFIYIVDNAIVDHCKIHDWKRPVGKSIAVQWSHGAVMIDGAGATLRNSLVYNNEHGDSMRTNAPSERAYYNGGAIMIPNLGGTVENCTITGNTAGGNGGGIYAYTHLAVIRNCIVYGNTSYSGGTDIWAPNVAGVTYTCASDIGNTTYVKSGGGAGCTAADPKLSGRSNLYRLTADSVACIDRGVATTASGAAGATDLFGHPRVIGTAVDIGCHEFLKSYVSTKGGNVVPYDSWANASTDLDTVFNLKPDEVEIGDGTFTYTSVQRILTWKNYIHSSNGPSKTTLSSVANQGHFRLESGSEGSVLAGLTFLNGYYDPYGASYLDPKGTDFARCAPLYLAAGTISNCVVKGVFKYHHSYAPIVYLGGYSQMLDSDLQGDWDGSTHATDGSSAFVLVTGNGLIDRCSIHDWKRPVGGGKALWYAHCAVQLDSANATLRNSLLFRNEHGDSIRTNGYVWGTAKLNYNGGAVLIKDGGVVENCTITGNSAGGNGGGIYAYSHLAVIRNCVVWGNTSYSGGTDIWAGNVPGVTYTCASDIGNTAYIKDGGGAGCFAKDPRFKNCGNTLYLLRGNSPCRGVGDASVASTLDLLCNPRKLHGCIDLGCYETPLTGLSLILR